MKSQKTVEQNGGYRVPLLWSLILCLAAIRLWLATSQSLTALGGAVYDDRLFLNLADSLLKGKWLGPYSNLTLAKGPFYSFWIAAMANLGVPLLLSEHLLYIAACLVFVIAVKPILHTPLALFLLFAVLLFNPMSYSQPMMTQVLRDGIYPALTVLVVSCAVGLLVRTGGTFGSLAPWAAGLGLSLSAFFLTREEGIWISPLLIIVLGAAGFRAWRTSQLWKSLFVVALPFAIAAVFVCGVAEINKSEYGLFEVNEIKSKDFLSAYGALLRVKHDERTSVVPVPGEVRGKIYRASPSFAQLRPYLEGDLGKRWLGVIENTRKLYAEDPEFARKVRLYLNEDPTGIWERALFGEGRDLMGGWFVWAFREAVEAAGHHSSASAAAVYYRRLAAEVNAACADGRLSCTGERSSLMPPWRNGYAPLVLKTFAWGVLSVIRFEGVNVQSDPSLGDEHSLKLFREITRERLAPSQFRVQGWIFSPDKVLTVSVTRQDGTPIGESVPLLPSPDVYAYFRSQGTNAANARNARFDIRLAPYSGACCLSLSAGGKQLKMIPLDGSVKYLDRDDLRLNIEVLDFGAGSRGGLKLRILDRIGKSYQFFMPLLVVFSLIAYMAAGIVTPRKAEEKVILIIATSLILAVGMRLALLAVIHVTSFPAIIPQYLAPLHPLVILFAMLVLAEPARKLAEMFPCGKREKVTI